MQKKYFFSLSLLLLCIHNLAFSMQEPKELKQQNIQKTAVTILQENAKNKQKNRWLHFKKSFAEFNDYCIENHVIS